MKGPHIVQGRRRERGICLHATDQAVTLFVLILVTSVHLFFVLMRPHYLARPFSVFVKQLPYLHRGNPCTSSRLPSLRNSISPVSNRCSSTRLYATIMDTKARRIVDDLEKPDLDDRSYRVIELPNKLEALLVHDPQTDKASASLNVNVGNFSDDDDMPGMAHAVEHLLFMGTEKVSASTIPAFDSSLTKTVSRRERVQFVSVLTQWPQ